MPEEVIEYINMKAELSKNKIYNDEIVRVGLWRRGELQENEDEGVDTDNDKDTEIAGPNFFTPNNYADINDPEDDIDKRLIEQKNAK